MLEDALFVPVVVAVIAVVNLVLLILLLRLSSQVSHLCALVAARAELASERGMGERSDRSDRLDLSARPEQSDGPDASVDTTKWFEAFLAEDPLRRALPKNEQFAAFRRWRSEKGMNWKSPSRSV